MRPTLQQLAMELYYADRSVRCGHYYRHQASGKVYEVTGHVIHEATGAPMVTYRPALLDGQFERHGLCERPESECVFARPVAEFIEEVEWANNGVSMKGPRFVEVYKIESWTE